MKTPKSSRTSSLKKYLALSIGLAVAGLSTQTARADTVWVGGVSQDWTNASNWDNGLPGTGNNDAIINTATGNYPILTTTGTSSRDIRVGAGSNGRLDQTSGLLSTGDGSWFFIGYAGAQATYNLANTGTTGGTFTGFGQGSGSLNVGGPSQNGNVLVGLDNGTLSTWNINTSGTVAAGGIFLSGAGANTATLNMDGGTVNVSGEMQTGGSFYGNGGVGILNMSGGTITANILSFARGNNNAAAITGTANITGGTLNSLQWFTLGFAGSSSNTAVVHNNGGTINVNTSGGGNMEMGVFDQTQNTFLQDSGTLKLENNAFISFGNGGNHTGASTFTQNNGTVTFYSDGGTTVGGTGYISLGLGGDSGTYTYNLNGGTLTVPKIQRTASGGTGTFNFNGGTLKATGNNAAFMQGLTAANVQAGGAIIDSNGSNITIGQALLNGGGGGGLTKNGSGTLTLGGANTYTGLTTVSNGTLAFATSQSSIGSVTVANNAGLGVQAATAGSTLLTTTGLTLGTSGTTSLTFDFNNLNTTAALISTGTGALTASGTVNVTLLNGGLLSSGSHTLISYTSFAGGGTFSGSPFTLGPRSTGTLVNNGTNALLLSVSANSPVWTGADNGNWKVGATGANKNWKLLTGGAATDYIEGDAVLFDDTVGAGVTAIDINTANVSPAVTTFNNSTKNYTLGSSGTFGIAGTGPLIKSGTGMVTITSTNSYNGGTTINAGTIAINNAASLGATSGAVTMNGGTLEALNAITTSRNFLLSGTGTIQVDAGNYQIDGSVSNGAGTGTLVKTGTGTLVLTAANTYSGGTTINNGTLQITTTAGLANSGTFTLNGGSFQINTSANNFNYAPTINVTSDSTTFSNVGTGAINYTGALTGNSNVLTVTSGSTRIYINGPVSGITQFNVTSGAMGFDMNFANPGGGASVNVSNGASLWYANNGNAITGNLTFNGGNGINGGGALYYEGGVPVPTAFPGAITLASGTTGIGSQYGDTITLNGNITGAGALSQINGTVILAGSNNYSGGTTINAGTLQLGNGGTSGSLLGSTAITNNGTLAFNRSDTITQGTHFGTINGTGGVTVLGGGTVVLNAANTYTGTTLVRNGTLQVSNSINTPASQVQVGYGNTGSAVLDLQSGATVSAGSVEVAHADNIGGTQTGTVNIASGATLNSEADFQMGFAGGPTAQGTVNINGGTLNVATTVTRWMIIGRYDTVNSTVNVNSGNLNLNANTDLRFSIGTGGTGTGGNGNRGTNVINLNGGAITSYSDNATTANGAGVLDLNRFGGPLANNTFNLNGGTLAIRQVMTDADDGTVAFNFNGGTLKATGNTANFVDLGGASQTANVQAGGAIIDSNGFDVTIPQALLSGTVGDGGLTKNGAGTLTLTASNSYTGATNVNNGTLEFAQPDASVVVLTGSLNIATTGTAVLTAHGGDASQVKVLDLSALSITTMFAPGGVAEGGSAGDLLVSPAPVPEPNTWAMLLAGLVTLAVFQHRRKRTLSSIE